MTNQFVSIVEISTLHDVLIEIKSVFSFKIFNFKNTHDFLNKQNTENLDVLNSIIVFKKNNNHLLSSKIIDSKNLIMMDVNKYDFNQI